ncbi:TPA: hypothetical protein ACIQMB_003804 [Bacillus pacificus]|uniref:hypothetical protein n=1 Tax=Bacillus pacificus TaxID=2026187 RepID=UPI0015EC0D75
MQRFIFDTTSTDKHWLIGIFKLELSNTIKKETCAYAQVSFQKSSSIFFHRTDYEGLKLLFHGMYHLPENGNA